MTPDQRLRLYEILRAADPAPTTELAYATPFELLVAVVLSAQATDVSVNKATTVLYPQANTPAAIAALGEEGLKEFIKKIGLYRTKAKNVIALCQLLLDRHGGEVPRERDALEALPGVGRKTASVVLNTAFGEPTIAVDTHIFRVANRTGLAPGKDPRKVEDGLVKVTPPEFAQHAHHWLLLHGRYVCKARLPECWRCPIVDCCDYQPKTPAPGSAATAAASVVTGLPRDATARDEATADDAGAASETVRRAPKTTKGLRAPADATASSTGAGSKGETRSLKPAAPTARKPGRKP